MTGKNTRGLFVCAVLAAAALGVTACGDSSTATAPLTQDATIATMSGHSSAPAAGSSDPAADAAASSSAEEAASKATTELPATKPSPQTTGANTGAEAGEGQPNGGQTNGRALTQKEKNYLAALKRADVSFMGDDDNAVALAWGHYVCREKGKNTDPSVIKVYIRAGIGPTTQSEQEAGAKADKLIAAAEKNLC